MADKSDDLVALVVADCWSVFSDGQQRSAGDTVRADPETAKHWLRRGRLSQSDNAGQGRE